MSSEDHQHAGQGPVLLDIGDDIGALVLTMPAVLQGVEIEMRPVGSRGSHELRHVGVVPRSAGGRQVHVAVFAEVREGLYELYQRPAGPVRLHISVTGGQVTQASWPE